MFRRKRILLLSSSVILLCVCLIVGATFALFTEETTVTTHLKAGELDATLVRRSGYYTALNDGVLYKYELNGTNVDFTEPTTENFFGDIGNKLIVPLSTFEVVYELGHKANSTTAYTYDVVIAPREGNSVLADQLWVEMGTAVANADGTYTYTKLSEGWANDGSYKLSSANGTYVKPGTTSGLLYTRVTFMDDRADDNDFVNNRAQGLELNFDLVVTATQYTEVVNG